VQTFLPYSDFEKSARVLDYRRLGKQRVEALQILRTLRGVTSGWANHPAVRMWSGYEACLGQYMRVMILEWLKRGYRNTIEIPRRIVRVKSPPWLGREDFHSSHRSNLLRKDSKWYRRFGWAEPKNLPYVWPVECHNSKGSA
jgi:hypothetical protein